MGKMAGDIPGIPVGFKFWSRAEMAVTGAHFAPVSGIDYVTENQDKEGGYVTSIVVSGYYEVSQANASVHAPACAQQPFPFFPTSICHAEHSPGFIYLPTQLLLPCSPCS
jgi:hypothetical protein